MPKSAEPSFKHVQVWLEQQPPHPLLASAERRQSFPVEGLNYLMDEEVPLRWQLFQKAREAGDDTEAAVHLLSAMYAAHTAVLYHDAGHGVPIAAGRQSITKLMTDWKVNTPRDRLQATKQRWALDFDKVMGKPYLANKAGACLMPGFQTLVNSAVMLDLETGCLAEPPKSEPTVEERTAPEPHRISRRRRALVTAKYFANSFFGS
ncbi:MAG TPA: hypothetical protein VFH39_01770 [Candidatus Saccharimonadales bacterium]|nr:hypothetical protein [Candidatus Saccharimonadales bacterium]